MVLSYLYVIKNPAAKTAYVGETTQRHRITLNLAERLKLPTVVYPMIVQDGIEGHRYRQLLEDRMSEKLRVEGWETVQKPQSETAKRMSASKPPEWFKKRADKIRESWNDPGRRKAQSERTKELNKKLGPGYRSEGNRKAWERMTPGQRSDLIEKMKEGKKMAKRKRTEISMNENEHKAGSA